MVSFVSLIAGHFLPCWKARLIQVRIAGFFPVSRCELVADGFECFLRLISALLIVDSKPILPGYRTPLCPEDAFQVACNLES